MGSLLVSTTRAKELLLLLWRLACLVHESKATFDPAFMPYRAFFIEKTQEERIKIAKAHANRKQQDRRRDGKPPARPRRALTPLPPYPPPFHINLGPQQRIEIVSATRKTNGEGQRTAPVYAEDKLALIELFKAKLQRCDDDTPWETVREKR